MKWTLIFQLSLFGMVMAFATVFFIPSNIEPVFWLLIFIASVYLIALNSGGYYFWHGFAVSLLNCFWITMLHIIFYKTYISYHPEEASMLSKMPIPEAPRLMMLITGPVIGIISGTLLGLFSLIASKFLKNKAAG